MKRLEVRAFVPEDACQVLALLSDCMDWTTDERHRRLFMWKHFENPFGPSLGRVALDGDTVVGFRPFLRWDFEVEGTTLRAARAVDTAIHPDWRRRGLFSQLTESGVDDLADHDVEVIFNTPNAVSRAGYLKLGWAVVGRLPLELRLRSFRSLPVVARARGPAGKWPLSRDIGLDAGDALSDADGLAELLASQPRPRRLQTRRTDTFLRWRYGLVGLGYRALLAGSSLADGIVLFRLRRRGHATEASICDVITPGADHDAARSLASRVVREAGADYAVQLRGSAGRMKGFLPASGQGPVLTMRPLRGPAAVALTNLDLSLGDIELF